MGDGSLFESHMDCMEARCFHHERERMITVLDYPLPPSLCVHGRLFGVLELLLFLWVAIGYVACIGVQCDVVLRLFDVFSVIVGGDQDLCPGD